MAVLWGWGMGPLQVPENTMQAFLREWSFEGRQPPSWASVLRKHPGPLRHPLLTPNPHLTRQHWERICHPLSATLTAWTLLVLRTQQVSSHSAGLPHRNLVGLRTPSHPGTPTSH